MKLYPFVGLKSKKGGGDNWRNEDKEYYLQSVCPTNIKKKGREGESINFLSKKECVKQKVKRGEIEWIETLQPKEKK